MGSVELYDRKSCPYSTKVRNKLEELGIEYDETTVPEAHKDRDRVKERTGQTGVPVLFDENLDDDFLADSREIVSYLERQYS